MYRITNNSPGRRGLWSRGQLVWLDPGQTKSLHLDNVRGARLVRGLEIEPDGDLPEVPADLAKAATKAPKRQAKPRTTRRRKAT